MPRLDSFSIELKTGESALKGPLKFIINGFPLEFDEVEGGTGSGETFSATGAPGSFPHTLLLHGPEEGDWEVEGFSVTYHPNGEEPYRIRFGGVTVDSASDLNIWADRPSPVMDV
jgi:hypothetical protein